MQSCTYPGSWECNWTQELTLMITLQGINISHLGNRKIIFKMPFLGDMLVPWRVDYTICIESDVFCLLCLGTRACKACLLLGCTSWDAVSCVFYWNPLVEAGRYTLLFTLFTTYCYHHNENKNNKNNKNKNKNNHNNHNNNDKDNDKNS